MPVYRLTKDAIVLLKTYETFLDKSGRSGDAHASIVAFLGTSEPPRDDVVSLKNRVRRPTFQPIKQKALVGQLLDALKVAADAA